MVFYYNENQEGGDTMAGKNERGAGRKPVFTETEIEMIRKRRDDGETVTALAKELGVSRQTVSSYLHRKDMDASFVYRSIAAWKKLNHAFQGIDLSEYTMRMDYMYKEDICSVILVNYREQKIAVINETDDLIHRAFGVRVRPGWKEFEEFLESRCFPRTRDRIRMVLEDIGLDFYDPLSIIEKTEGRMAEDGQWIRIYRLCM